MSLNIRHHAFLSMYTEYYIHVIKEIDLNGIRVTVPNHGGIKVIKL